jgi:hypothetical protein
VLVQAREEQSKFRGRTAHLYSLVQKVRLADTDPIVTRHQGTQGSKWLLGSLFGATGMNFPIDLQIYQGLAQQNCWVIKIYYHHCFGFLVVHLC